MDKLKFIGSLDQEQSDNAVKVAQMAKKAGVDPNLAVAIAFKESGLRTNAPRGASGEIGMMQVMPSTGKGLGYDEEKLSIPNQNIKAGIEYLKLGLQASENDPTLAAIYYNGGPGAVEALKLGKDPDPRVFNYVRALNGYGTFDTEPKPAQRGESDLVLGDAPPPAPPPAADTSSADPAERFLFGGAGAAAGALFTGKSAYDTQRTSTLANRAGAEEAARIAARRAAASSAIPPGSPGSPGASVMRPPIPAGGLDAGRLPGMQAPAPGSVPSPASPVSGLSGGAGASPQAVRIQQGTTGDLGTTGRARMTGFNTESAQMSDAQKAAYSRAQVLKNMGVVAQDAPEFFSRQPGMTSSPAGVLFPRSEIPPATTVGPRGPQGQIGGGRPPTPPPIPSVLAGASPGDLSLRPPVPPPSNMAQIAKTGLDTVTDLFKGMMRPVVSAVGTVGKYALSPVAGLSAGLDLADIAHEYDKPADQRDLTKMALKGTSALGGALSIFPPSALVGIPLSLGATAAQAYRDDPEYFKQKLKEYTGYAP